MTSEENAAKPADERGPILRARVARALRSLVVLRGWEAVVNRCVPHHRGPFTVRYRDSLFHGDIGSFIDRQVYLFGGYEPGKIRAFLANISTERHGAVLDIGANAGTHSIAFARTFKTVLAFEPNPNLWPQFEKNMALNSLTNVQLHKIGLADRDSNITLHAIDKPNQGLGTFSTQNQYDLPLRPIATCPVRHAGDYLAEIGVERVDAVKIDVQGFEPEVLVGLERILKRDRPVLWCEIGAGTSTKIENIQDLQALVPFKFRCFEMVPRSKWWKAGAAKLKERRTSLPQGDYLILPE